MSLQDKFEVYSLTCDTIRKGLKERVNAYVKVGVDAYTDTLQVQINSDDVKFGYERRYWLTFVACGERMDDIINEIIKEYKKCVLKHYFKA